MWVVAVLQVAVQIIQQSTSTSITNNNQHLTILSKLQQSMPYNFAFALQTHLVDILYIEALTFESRALSSCGLRALSEEPRSSGWPKTLEMTDERRETRDERRETRDES